MNAPNTGGQRHRRSQLRRFSKSGTIMRIVLRSSRCCRELLGGLKIAADQIMCAHDLQFKKEDIQNGNTKRIRRASACRITE